MFSNSRSFLCFTFAGIIFQSRSLNLTDISFGFDAASYLTGECLPCVCARGRPQLDDCGQNAAPEYGCSVSVGKIVVRVMLRSQDCNFLVVVTVLGTSRTIVPADSKHFDSCHWPDLHVIVKNCLSSRFSRIPWPCVFSA